MSVSNDTPPMITFGPFRFDQHNGLLYKNGQEIPLPPRALGVLRELVRRSGQVISKQELLDAVWKDVVVEEASLKEAISSLRQILGDDPKQPAYIQTMHRRGYRFVAKPATAGAAEKRAETASAVASKHGLLRGQAVIWIVALIVLGCVLAAFAWWRPHTGRQDTTEIARFTVAPPAGGAFTNMDTPILAMTRDGSRFAFVARRGDTSQLYLRTLAQPDPVLIAGSDGAEAPFFSPDGKWLGFCANGMLKIVQPGSGAPISLTQLSDCDGASWGKNGEIVFGSANGLWSISASGGAPILLTHADAAKGEIGHWWPDILPDGSVVFTVWKGVLSHAQLALLRPGAHTYRVIFEGASDPHYLPDGHLLVAEQNGVVTLPFDLASGTIRGVPLSTDAHVAVNTFMGVAQIAAAANGSRVMLTGNGQPFSAHLDWADTSGKITPSSLPARAYGDAVLAPRGNSVAVTINGPDSYDIWIGNLVRGSLTRLTTQGFNAQPVWSPDGQWITYSTTAHGQVSIWRRRADGSGTPQLLTSGSEPRWPSSYSPDGKQLAFTLTAADQNEQLGFLTLDGQKQAVSLPHAPGNQSDARFSPDGHWLVYLSDASGRFPGDYQVFLRAFPGPGPTWPVSIGSGQDAAWAPDGQTVYYKDGNGIWAVPVQLSSPPVIGKPRKLFDASSAMLCGVSPDGKRLLLIVPDRPDGLSNRILVEIHSP